MFRWSPTSTSPCCHPRVRAPFYPPTSTRAFVCDRNFWLSRPIGTTKCIHVVKIVWLRRCCLPQLLSIQKYPSEGQNTVLNTDSLHCAYLHQKKWLGMYKGTIDGQYYILQHICNCTIWKYSVLKSVGQDNAACTCSYCPLVNFWINIFVFVL